VGKDTSDNEKADGPAQLMKLTLAANQLAKADGAINGYEMRNHLLEQRRQARVRYKNGFTLPASAANLRADADRKVRHSRTLARNIRNATGVAKHADADAHHVVAAADGRAQESRKIIFHWGIGINDADNGLYLPRTASSNVPGLGSATAHSGIHTTAYHFAIQARLFEVQEEDVTIGRATLRDIKQEILNDEFTY